MIQEDMYSLVSGATSPIADVHPVRVPQNVAYPAVTLSRQTTSRDMNFTEVENFVRSVFQVDIYAPRYTAAASLAESIKSALNNHREGAIHGIRLDFELDASEDTADLFHILQQYTVWHIE